MFSKKNLILALFGLAVANALIFLIAVYVDYRILNFADILLHLWGGFVVSFAYCIYFREGIAPIKNRLILLLSIVGVAMLVGVAWEWYEWAFDLFVGRDRNLLNTQLGLNDTMKDLLNDLLGGLFVAWLYMKQKRK